MVLYQTVVWPWNRVGSPWQWSQSQAAGLQGACGQRSQTNGLDVSAPACSQDLDSIVLVGPFQLYLRNTARCAGTVPVASQLATGCQRRRREGRAAALRCAPPGGGRSAIKAMVQSSAHLAPCSAMAPERHPPAFEGAGQESGLQVWRVERLELVPVPPSRHGDFFVGDAYLVLHTVRRGAAVAYRLHYWLGRQRGSGAERNRTGQGGSTASLHEVCPGCFWSIQAEAGIWGVGGAVPRCYAAKGCWA